MLNLPVTDPVWVLSIASAALLLAPYLAQALRLPQVVVLIALGGVVGPAGLGLLERSETMVLLGTLGLLYLLFQVGLELDLRGFVRQRQQSILLGLLSFALPSALALLIAPMFGFSTAGTLLVAAIVASHTLLAYPVVARLGVARDPAVTAAVGGTLLTDTLSMTLLALVASLALGDADLWAALRLMLLLGAVALSILLLLPRLADAVFRRTDGETSVRFIFMLSTMLFSAAAAAAAGASAIIGAFLAGLALNRMVPNTSTAMARVRFVGEAIFIPFFLLSVGMLLDVRVLLAPATLVLAVLLTSMVLVGKGGAALLSQRLLGFSAPQGWVMVGLTIPQAAATLAVTFVGLELGLFGPAMVNAVIAMILVTTLLGATLAERSARAIAVTAPERASEGVAPRRILVPVANPATAEALLDLAFMLRQGIAEEALFPLAVVRDAGDVGARVVAAERVLAHALVYATEAEAVVTPVTRVALNPAVGIAQAIREQRITDVVLGWQGSSSARAATFGNVIDQVLAQSDAQLWVQRIDRPLVARGRAFLILPERISATPGFPGAMLALARLLSTLGAPVTLLHLGGDGAATRARLAALPVRLEAAFEEVATPSELLRLLGERVGDQDLTLMVGARGGTLAWTPALERLPGLLAGLPGAFLAVLPGSSEVEGVVERRGGMSALLTPDDVEIALSGDRAAALETLLARLVDPRQPAFAELLRAVVEDDVGFANELLPGALLAHLRSAAVDRPRLAVGLHPSGVAHPKAGAPLRVVALLISPDEGEMQPHLTRLARVAQRLRSIGSEALLEAADARALVALLTRRGSDQ